MSTTETRAARFADVETWSDEAVLAAIAAGQAQAIAACQGAIVSISTAARVLAEGWQRGGRIGYTGAGSSGLIAMLDALELPVTYGMEAERLPLTLAGGEVSMTALDQRAEDDEASAAVAFAASGLGPGDAMIAVSASGQTPFTLAVARAARGVGVRILGISCNRGAPLLDLSDVAILLDTGPEIVAGSTRMNAGTAQKCALNMISTLTAIRLHHVYQGMMVNLRAENEKLRERAAGIVATVTGTDQDTARRHLRAADWDVKHALLVANGATLAEAKSVLAQAGGSVRDSLERLVAPR